MNEILTSTYEIIKKIGAGGGGNVYLAYHKRLNKKVVLKADKRQLSTPPELLRREVDVLKTLRHAHIPQVYDFFVENDTVYTVMDYIEGESLDRALKRGQVFPQRQVIGWALQLLDALIYLHAPIHGDPPRGFLHSDIKPANIMRLPDDSICLIDFNIALALGEENIIGASAGYSSPEHYGLDYTGDGPTSMVPHGSPAVAEQSTLFDPGSEVTVTAGVDTRGNASKTATGNKLRTVTPDVRSDIYSTGATLYHLLSGRRPDRDARKVIPLTGDDCSPQVAEIINRAMQPNPDLRYQSAAQMRDAFLGLRANDPRAIRLKRQRRRAIAVASVGIVFGVSAAFLGLRRIQVSDHWLRLAADSTEALRQGDTTAALADALAAFPARNPLMPAYAPQAQTALTDALGVYDLADTYVPAGIVTLPSAPLCTRIAPDGSSAACLYAGALAILDPAAGTVAATLPADDSALSEVEYIDAETVAFAGAEGLCVYDLAEEKALWQGRPATGIAVSSDGRRVAAIYRNEPSATVYDAATGAVVTTVDFAGRAQQVVANDIFANPNDNLLALNRDGSRLAVSFADGSLWLYDLIDGQGINLLEGLSGYTHFEGGFSGDCLAFSATGVSDSIFIVYDTAGQTQTGGYQSASPFGVIANEDGVFVQTENLFVELDPYTGEQTPLVTTAKAISAFARSDGGALVTMADGFAFYDAAATETAFFETSDQLSFAALGGDWALVASRDLPAIRFLRYEQHEDETVFRYDPAYVHDEVRLSADGQTVMLFSYENFRVYTLDGAMIAEVAIPTPDQVYDQQFRREGDLSYLEVIYYDGTRARYDAATGSLLGEEKGDPPDPNLYEEFTTETLRITSPLHGTPTVYDRKTGRKIAELDAEAYLTYITQVEGGFVAQYVTADGVQYGKLYNSDCETLANLPDLCDVIEDVFVFDYPDGTVRKIRMYHIDELLQLAQTKMERMQENP